MLARKTGATLIVAAMMLVGACGGDDDDATDATTAPVDETEPDESSPSSSTPDTTSSATTEAPTDTDDTDPAQPSEDSVLTSRFAADPTVIDPLFVSNASDYALTSILFEGLIQPAPDGQVANVLAETWEPSDDGLSVDFTIKSGIPFHGGYGELTMEDVKFSIERAAGLVEGGEGNFFEGFYSELEGVEIIDDHTGRLLLKSPSVTIMEQALPLTGIISKAAFDEMGLEELQRNPIGTGPYAWAEATAGESVRLMNFPDYGGAAPYVPTDRFGELRFNIIPEDNAAELAYEAGDIDLLPNVRAAAVDRLGALDDTEIAEGAGMGYRFIGMNMIDPALENPDLRSAIRAAIDVESILLATSEGRDVRANAMVAPSAPIGYWDEAPVYEQDLEAARQLVELVPEEDRALRFTVSDDEVSRTVAQIAQANLEEAGLTVEIEILDPATFFVADETNRERQLFYTEYGINYREPSQEFVWFTCDQFDVWNYLYFCDEDYDRLFSEAGVELDRDARNDIYLQMQAIWDEAVNTIWVSHPTTLVAVRSNVEVEVDPTGTVFYQTLSPA